MERCSAQCSNALHAVFRATFDLSDALDADAIESNSLYGEQQDRVSTYTCFLLRQNCVMKTLNREACRVIASFCIDGKCLLRLLPLKLLG